jgi:hypothetical protein
MKPSELNSILKKARLPQPPEEFWEEFPEQVARQLNRPAVEFQRPRRNWLPRFVWATVTAACVVMAFAVGHWRGRVETQRMVTQTIVPQQEIAPSQDILANAKLVHDTLAMFPNQVSAIVEDSHGLHLVLSQNGAVPLSPPLYVHVCDGKNCSSLVTFSGQEIQVAGQKMTVLANTQGGIILMGPDFVWSSDQKTDSGNGLKIEAKSLELAAL